jgi:hypothetical protein
VPKYGYLRGDISYYIYMYMGDWYGKKALWVPDLKRNVLMLTLMSAQSRICGKTKVKTTLDRHPCLLANGWLCKGEICQFSPWYEPFFFFPLHVLCLQLYLLFFCDCVHWHSSLEVLDWMWLENNFTGKKHILYENFCFLLNTIYTMYESLCYHWSKLYSRCGILNMMSIFPAFLP